MSSAAIFVWNLKELIVTHHRSTTLEWLLINYWRVYNRLGLEEDKQEREQRSRKGKVAKLVGAGPSS